MKAVWAVLDNSSKHVESFDYNNKAGAEAYIVEKTGDKKSFYLQLLKVPMD